MLKKLLPSTTKIGLILALFNLCQSTITKPLGLRYVGDQPVAVIAQPPAPAAQAQATGPALAPAVSQPMPRPANTARQKPSGQLRSNRGTATTTAPTLQSLAELNLSPEEQAIMQKFLKTKKRSPWGYVGSAALGALVSAVAIASIFTVVARRQPEKAKELVDKLAPKA